MEKEFQKTINFKREGKFLFNMTTTKDAICSSCNTKVANDAGSIKIMCPQCGKHEIVRCSHCREIVAKYECPECKFIGPN